MESRTRSPEIRYQTFVAEYGPDVLQITVLKSLTETVRQLMKSPVIDLNTIKLIHESQPCKLESY